MARETGIRSDGGDFTTEEEVFVRAVVDYMKENNRKFPAFTEVLAVAKSIGYRKTEAAGPIPRYKGEGGRAK